MKRNGAASSPKPPLTAAEVIAQLQLRPLPVEGGFYRETYRSPDLLPARTVARFDCVKSAATAIFYLLTPNTFSALHRLPTDEIYHYYIGDPVEMLLLEPSGAARELTLGSDLGAGQLVQVVAPAGVWQGSCLRSGGSYALLGTTMAPGFDFADFEAGERETLIRQFANHRSMIERLTRV